LDVTEKMIVKHSVECGIDIPMGAIRKDLIISYTPHYSVLMGDAKDSYNPKGQMRVKEVNVENCKVTLRTRPDHVEYMVIQGGCGLVDKAL
jgi:hypothetical protein